MNCNDCNKEEDIYECQRCSNIYCYDCLDLDKECTVCNKRLCQSCPDIRCTICTENVCVFHFIVFLRNLLQEF